MDEFERNRNAEVEQRWDAEFSGVVAVVLFVRRAELLFEVFLGLRDHVERFFAAHARIAAEDLARRGFYMFEEYLFQA